MKQLNDSQQILLYKMGTRDSIEKMKLSLEQRRWILYMTKRTDCELITDNESKMLNLIRKKYIREVLGKWDS